ncbi:MAG: cyclase family protein [Geminicoccaceae bacterium]
MPDRRDLLGAALAGVLAPVAVRASVEALPDTEPVENDADIDRLLPTLSNWGRWGPDDQLGTLNFITPALRLAAAQLIRTGRVVPLARQMPVANAPGARRQVYELKRYEDPPPEESGCFDFIGLVYHGFVVTHIDALCHIFTPEGKQGMYNGFPISAVTPDGAEKLGVEVMGAVGIVGRGVLLDVAALKGGAPVPGSAITPADLVAAEARQGVLVGEGDILFVRNGAGPRNVLQHGTGLHAACLPWLHQRKIAVLSNDSDSDIHPAPPGFERWTEAMHMVALPYLGLPLLDNADLETLSRVCAEEQRWEFFVSVAPWRFKGATSSPVNPLAVF